jgi:SAM-dependent methyltransferase
VLDLGCGVGDQAALLVERGAQVTGVDANPELLAAARKRALGNCDFLKADLRQLPTFPDDFDGVWCSFAAAYFVDLPLLEWTKPLRRGGWIAITEIDDLFGHEPLRESTKARFEEYASDALKAKRYDFKMGRKLERHLKDAGFVVSRVMTLDDAELAFWGAARPEVLEAWRNRFERMTLLRGDELRQELLTCLARDDHRSLAKVYCCIATKP